MTLNDNNTGKFMANVPYFFSMNERDTYELSHKTKYVSQIFLILLIKKDFINNCCNTSRSLGQKKPAVNHSLITERG